MRKVDTTIERAAHVRIVVTVRKGQTPLPSNVTNVRSVRVQRSCSEQCDWNRAWAVPLSAGPKPEIDWW